MNKIDYESRPGRIRFILKHHGHDISDKTFLMIKDIVNQGELEAREEELREVKSKFHKKFAKCGVMTKTGRFKKITVSTALKFLTVLIFKD